MNRQASRQVAELCDKGQSGGTSRGHLQREGRAGLSGRGPPAQAPGAARCRRGGHRGQAGATGPHARPCQGLPACRTLQTPGPRPPPRPRGAARPTLASRASGPRAEGAPRLWLLAARPPALGSRGFAAWSPALAYGSPTGQAATPGSARPSLVPAPCTPHPAWSPQHPRSSVSWGPRFPDEKVGLGEASGFPRAWPPVTSA